MTVYVDGLVTYGGTYRSPQARLVGARAGNRWCHLFADEADGEEVHRFAEGIGLRRAWFHRDHYDLTPNKRRQAIAHGAVEVTARESVEIWHRWADGESPGVSSDPRGSE
jgi:hypothetical protein